MANYIDHNFFYKKKQKGKTSKAMNAFSRHYSATQCKPMKNLKISKNNKYCKKSISG